MKTISIFLAILLSLPIVSTAEDFFDFGEFLGIAEYQAVVSGSCKKELIEGIRNPPNCAAWLIQTDKWLKKRTGFLSLGEESFKEQMKLQLTLEQTKKLTHLMTEINSNHTVIEQILEKK